MTTSGSARAGSAARAPTGRATSGAMPPAGIGHQRSQTFAMMMATTVEQNVANSVVGRMPAGSADPAAARSAMTPVGSSVTLDVLIARNSTIALLAVPFAGLSASRCCMARMPNGVAALPNPSTFEDIFRIIAPIAGWVGGTCGNSLCISGRSSRAIMLNRPPASATFISPRNSVITPTRPMASVTAPWASSTIALATTLMICGSAATPTSCRTAATPKARQMIARKTAFMGAGWLAVRECVQPPEPAGVGSGRLLGKRQDTDQLEQPLADGRVGNAKVVVHQLERLARVHRIDVERLRRRLGQSEARRPHPHLLAHHSLEEERYLDPQRLRDLEQVAGADAVGAALVFLDLLKGYADRLAQLRLADAQPDAPAANTRADVLIDGVGAVFRYGLPHEGQVTSSCTGCRDSRQAATASGPWRTNRSTKALFREHPARSRPPARPRPFPTSRSVALARLENGRGNHESFEKKGDGRIASGGGD